MTRRNYYLLPLLILSGFLYSQCNDFIRLDGKKFKCGQSDFYPVAINYLTAILHTGSGPNPGTFPYNFPSRLCSQFLTPNYTNIPDQNTGYQIMVRDFKDMKLKGFNTIRACSEATSFGSLASHHTQFGPDDIFPYTDPATSELLLDITENILDAAKEADIRVILLVDGTWWEMIQDPDAYVNYLEKLAKRFKYHSSLMAIDFSNEPCPLVGFEPNKTEVCALTKRWNDAVKNNSQILTTIGLNGIDCINGINEGWDPNVVNVDFISFHNYPVLETPDNPGITDAINRIKSDYLWFSKNVRPPWIVGETGLNITGSSYALQAQYLGESLNACRDYGGSGYSWWCFMNAPDGSETMGVAELNNGHTGNTSILVWKPSADEVSNFNPVPNYTNAQPPNYFNYFLPDYTKPIYGCVKDQSLNPIEGALIQLHPASGKTYSDASGNFTVYPLATANFTGDQSLGVNAVDCQSQILWDTSINMINNFYTFILYKLPRPTNTSILNANQNVYNANTSQYASNDIAFFNFVIYSGTFNSKAGSYIKLNTGFSAKQGSNFSARIGSYYHNCDDINTGGNPFRTANQPINNGNSNSENLWPSQEIQIYPNPSNGIFKVTTGSKDPYRLEIYNMYGAKIRELFLTEPKAEIDLSEVSDGIYQFVIHSEKNGTCVKKVVKQ